MGRAARLKREKKNGTSPLGAGYQPDIQLQNPVNHAGHFPAWIFGNACSWEKMALASLQSEAPEEYAALGSLSESGTGLVAVSTAFREALQRSGAESHVAQQDSAKGQHIVICGAGPSLKETADEWCPQGDQVWGCNSAVTYLANAGHKVTHGFTVDQTAEMLGEWETVPDVTYLLASTVHPHLTEYLMGRNRLIRFFHNFVGIQDRRPVEYEDGTVVSYEVWMYDTYFPPTVCCGAGLNSINRAIDLAQFMGAGKITVLGADCALRFTGKPPGPIGSDVYREWLKRDVTMHADGGHALVSNTSELTMFGSVCGDRTCDGSKAKCQPEHLREWLTKVDMVISAVWLEKVRRKFPDQITLVGDTLPVALRDKPDSYLAVRLPHLVDKRGNTLPIL